MSYFKTYLALSVATIFGAAAIGQATRPEAPQPPQDAVTYNAQLPELKKCLEVKRGPFGLGLNNEDETSCKAAFPIAAAYCSNSSRVVPMITFGVAL